MTLSQRIYGTSHPTEGSRILYRRFHAGAATHSGLTGPHPVLPEAAPAPSYRIWRASPMSLPVVVPVLPDRAGTT